MTDKAIEQEIQAKGLTKPRVTPERIAAVIASEQYTTGAQMFGISDPTHPLALLTICGLVLQNGFTVTGESACASPENFDAELGRKIARANAVNKIWPLEGYLLKQRLHDAANRYTSDSALKLKIENADSQSVRIVTGEDGQGLVDDQLLHAGERATFQLPPSGQIVIAGPNSPAPVIYHESAGVSPLDEPATTHAAKPKKSARSKG